MTLVTFLKCYVGNLNPEFQNILPCPFLKRLDFEGFLQYRAIEIFEQKSLTDFHGVEILKYLKQPTS